MWVFLWIIGGYPVFLHLNLPPFTVYSSRMVVIYGANALPFESLTMMSPVFTICCVNIQTAPLLFHQNIHCFWEEMEKKSFTWERKKATKYLWWLRFTIRSLLALMLVHRGKLFISIVLRPTKSPCGLLIACCPKHLPPSEKYNTSLLKKSRQPCAH